MANPTTTQVADRVLRHMSERGCTAAEALALLIANGEAGRVRSVTPALLSAMERILDRMGL